MRSHGVPELIATARDAGMMVIHLLVAFRPGHPELSPRNAVFSVVKANGMLVAASEGAAIHPAAAAREGEPIVVKHRISPSLAPTWRRCCAPTASTHWCSPVSTPAASC